MFKFSALLFLVSVSALLASADCTPDSGAHVIHPNGDETKCLDVRGAVFTNNTVVQIFDCNGSNAQMWDIMPGTTAVKVHNYNFCLDAGSTPGNFVGTKIYECFDGLPAQTWFYTGDQRIALLNQGLCLDLPNGLHNNSNQLQTYTCTDGNTNQIWTLD